MAIVFVERVASKEQVEIHGSRGDRELATEVHEKKVKQDCSNVWPQRGSLHVTCRASGILEQDALADEPIPGGYRDPNYLLLRETSSNPWNQVCF
jgi:hypothetical protein